MATEWKPVKWKFDPQSRVSIDECPQLKGLPQFAIRKDGDCMNKQSKWEYEPLPSSRTNAFFKRCRFKTFEAAAKVYEESLTKAVDNLA